jgi:alpha-tubulin suppressor-like RCC1 family protein
MERFFRQSADSTPMRLAIAALVTSIGTLAWAPVATGTQSGETDQRVGAGAGLAASLHMSGAAEPTTLKDPFGAPEYATEDVGVTVGRHGPCCTPEEGRTSTAKSGSWSSLTITSGYQWELCSGLEENNCTPISEAKETSHTPSVEVVGSEPHAPVTVTGSAEPESASAAKTAEAGPVGVAWGNNYPAGQLGAGYKDSYEVAPVIVRGLSEIRSMVPAGENSYALLDSGVVRAWGSAVQGALGNGEHLRKAPNSPVAVVEKTNNGEIREMTDVTAIAAAVGAYRHGMALVSDKQNEDEVMTWGASAFGERGNGEYDNEDEGHAIKPRDLAIAVPGLERKHTIAIAAGGDSDFALQEEGGGRTTLWAWGGNNYGKLGIDTERGKTCKGDGAAKQFCLPTPQRVDLSVLRANVNVRAISAGKHAAYALLSDGRVLAWGENMYGQLGDGTSENGDVPTYVCALHHVGSCPNGPYLEHVKAVSGGELFALALLEDGEVVGWGNNVSGSLSGESHEQCKHEELTFCQRTPKTVEGLQGVAAISAGSEYGLALVNNSEHQGQVYSWGSNEHGQLGDGKAEGPETCGDRKIRHGGTVESVERQCSRKPLPINGLSDVGGISAADGADPYNGSYAHSFAYLQSGAGPAPLLTVTPEERKGKQALQVDWNVASSPESDYKVRWKEDPPAGNLNIVKVEELEQEAEEALAIAGEWGEAAEEAEEAEGAKGAKQEIKQDLKDQERYQGKAEALKQEENEYEEAADKEYPSSEITKVTKTCTENPREWCETIAEARDSKDENAPLSNETSYLITLNVIGGGGDGDSAIRIVGTTPP